jgi:hypothetical protein
VEDYDHEDLEPTEWDGADYVINCHFLLQQLFFLPLCTSSIGRDQCLSEVPSELMRRWIHIRLDLKRLKVLPHRGCPLLLWPEHNG